MKTQGNLFTFPAESPTQNEFIDILADGSGGRIERIVSHGHTTRPGEWYDQDTDEWVVVLRGEATLEWKNGDVTELRTGDWLLIPAHRQHRVASTSDDPPCVWLAVHGDLSSDGQSGV
jgi:cupin 2 domain-containing protein